MRLDIDGMGCEACQLHVRTVIGKRQACFFVNTSSVGAHELLLISFAEMSAGVLGSAVDWKAGKAELCAFLTIGNALLNSLGECRV